MPQDTGARRPRNPPSRSIRPARRGGATMTRPPRDAAAQESEIDSTALVTGRVMWHAEYSDLLRIDGGGDLYLNHAERHRALHGDRVRAKVLGVDGAQRAVIVEVLERRSQRLVGRIVRTGDSVTVIPDDKRLTLSVAIAGGQDLGAKHGQIVVVETTASPDDARALSGRVIEYFGEKLGTPQIVPLALAAHGLSQRWPTEVGAEAEVIETQVNAVDHPDRADLRNLPFVTIDGEDARDFDDAVHAVRLHDGDFRLWVAIADVAHYVPIGSALDREAEARGTSVYLPDCVVPMLPEALSNGICSLKPDVDRLALVCEMRVGADGEVRDARFRHAVIRSHARLTYTQTWQVLSGDADARCALSELCSVLDDLHALYRVLATARAARGALEFDSPKARFHLNTAGRVQMLGVDVRNDAHRLVEECMIAANVQAARFLERRRMPAPYRVHDKPPQDKYVALQAFLGGVGLRLPDLEAVTPKDFAVLLQNSPKQSRAALQSALLGAQSLAAYQVDNGGHFGLALKAYTHFTSPIRRYPDLLVHRVIGHVLRCGPHEDTPYRHEAMIECARHCSQRERIAVEVEREVERGYQCAFLARHGSRRCVGVVTGVTSFGLFIEMEETRVSGLLHVSRLDGGFYHFDAARRWLRDEYSGRCYRLGQRIAVRVLRASLEDRRVDLRLA